MTGTDRSGTTRRAYLRMVGATAAGTTLLDGSRTVRAATDEAWPQYGFDPANTSYAPDNEGPVASISRAWRFREKGPDGSAPTVVGDSVYAGIGDDMYVLSTADGTMQWRKRYQSMIRSTPAVADGRVYVGAEDKVRAFDVETETEEWLFGANGEVDASPIVVDGTVYVGSRDRQMYALDSETGTEQWSYDAGFQEGITSTAAVADGDLYVGATADRLISLNASDGAERWVLGADGRIQTAPVVVDDTVYATSANGYVYAVRVDNGVRRWYFNLDTRIDSGLAVVDGLLYFGDEDGRLSAIDIETARQTYSYEESLEWSFEADGPVHSPVIVDGTVYVGSDDGHVYALDATDGTRHWSIEVGGSITSPPAVADKTVYVRSDDRGLFALELSVTADLSYSPASPITEETVTFDASGSSPESIISSYEWTIDGETLTGQTVEYTFDRQDNFEVELTVSDEQGHTDTASTLVAVDAQPPTAAFTYAPDPPVAGEPVIFDASPSSDPDGPVTEYQWLIGGVRSANGQSVEHTFAKPGRYSVKLTVRDEDRETDTTRQTITVTDPDAPTTTPGQPTTTPGQPTTTPGQPTTTPGQPTTTPGQPTTTPGQPTTTPETTTVGAVDAAGGNGGDPPSSEISQPDQWAQLGIGAVASLTGLASWLHFDMASRASETSLGVVQASPDGGQTAGDDVDLETDEEWTSKEVTSTDDPPTDDQSDEAPTGEESDEAPTGDQSDETSVHEDS